MYSAPRIALKYIKYLLTASNGKGHGIHSPFVFQLVQQVLQAKETTPLYQQIEQERNTLLMDKSTIPMSDFGAGSRFGNPGQKKVADIARHSLKSPKFGQLMHRLAGFVSARHILELGTSLGITSAYLAKADGVEKLHTLEGSPAIAARASAIFDTLGINDRVDLHVGDFAQTLPPLLEHTTRIDLAFLDGNHRYEPTVQYYRQIQPRMTGTGVMVLDDIHWSEEMEQAWNWVKSQAEVTLSIDLFFIGLVFFQTDFKVKQHYVIRF